MIRLTLSRHADGIDFAASPLWEALGSIGLVLRPDHLQQPHHRGWVHRARRVLDPRLAAALPDLVTALRLPAMPLCALPLPHQGTAPASGRFGHELDSVRQSHPADPGVQTACDHLERYWLSTMAPVWPGVRDAVAEEVSQLREVQAARGAGAALSSLRGRIAWRPPQLVAPFPAEFDRDVEGRLVIVPMAFAAGLRLFVVAGDSAALAVPSSRIPLLALARPAVPKPEPGRDAMSLLLGGGRAKVVRALETPATTTSVAGAIGLAKSTVSQHLSVLYEAGVVRRERRGTEVIYRLDHVGYALLRHLQDPGRRDSLNTSLIDHTGDSAAHPTT